MIMAVNGHADKGDEWVPEGRVFVAGASAGADATRIDPSLPCFLLPTASSGVPNQLL